MIEHFSKQLDEGWIPILTPLIEDKRFEQILKAVATSSKGFEPSMNILFRAFKECPYKDLSIVILGQDPYPQSGVATGLAFANRKDISPSLGIMIEELKSVKDFNEWLFYDKVGLEHWAKQGILLLNSALTVEVNSPGSHQEVWKYFIEGLLKELSKTNTAIIYVLMGKVAQSFKSCIKDTNYILEVAHPAADTYNNQMKFRGSNIFNNVNKIYHDLYGNNINWI